MDIFITVVITTIVILLLIALLNYFNFIDLSFPNQIDKTMDELTNEFEGTDIYEKKPKTKSKAIKKTKKTSKQKKS